MDGAIRSDERQSTKLKLQYNTLNISLLEIRYCLVYMCELYLYYRYPIDDGSQCTTRYTEEEGIANTMDATNTTPPLQWLLQVYKHVGNGVD